MCAQIACESSGRHQSQETTAGNNHPRVLAEQHLASLRAEHISDLTNVQAGWLSCTRLNQGEQSFSLETFQSLVQHFYLPCTDLFFSPINSKDTQILPKASVSTSRASGYSNVAMAMGPSAWLPPNTSDPKGSEQNETGGIADLPCPYWPRRPLFSSLLKSSLQPPWELLVSPSLLTQDPVCHLIRSFRP